MIQAFDRYVHYRSAFLAVIAVRPRIRVEMDEHLESPFNFGNSPTFAGLMLQVDRRHTM
jgi:hypothetical protein